jgi:hypothetical protein
MKELGKALVGVAGLAGAACFSSSQAWAQGMAAGLAKQLQGTWMLVSVTSEQGGNRIDVWGPNPRGQVIFAPDGRYCEVWTRDDLPKIAANNRTKGTPEENQTIMAGSLGHFGTYKVEDEKAGLVTLHIVTCTFPNWNGQDALRSMTIQGDALHIGNPAPSGGGGKIDITYKRAM